MSTFEGSNLSLPSILRWKRTETRFNFQNNRFTYKMSWARTIQDTDVSDVMSSREIPRCRGKMSTPLASKSSHVNRVPLTSSTLNLVRGLEDKKCLWIDVGVNKHHYPMTGKREIFSDSNWVWEYSSLVFGTSIRVTRDRGHPDTTWSKKTSRRGQRTIKYRDILVLT